MNKNNENPVEGEKPVVNVAESGAVTEPPNASEPKASVAAAESVPFDRFQGVQRKLSATETELAAVKVEREQLNGSLAAANQAAAKAEIARILATDKEVVSEMLTGKTLDEVSASYNTAKIAFSNARAAFARTLPVNPAQSSQQVATPALDANPAVNIAAGLKAGKSEDINK